MPFRATFACLWCGTAHTTRGSDDLEGWAQLCPDCVGKAGDNGFLRFRLRQAIEERGAATRGTDSVAVAVAVAEPPVAPAAGATVATRDIAATRDVAADMRDYYEARAPEYDDWYLRRGRYAHGAIDDAVWNVELDAAGQWLDAIPFAGEIVELAAGTGWWSPLLASKGELSLYDTSPAALERARTRLVAHGLRAHLHVRDAWTEPDRAVDGVFAGFWLSHVERTDFGAFLALVRRWLRPGGRFAFIDSLADPASRADDHPAPADDRAVRRLAGRPRVHGRQGLPRTGRARGRADDCRIPRRRGVDDRPVLRARDRDAPLTARPTERATRLGILPPMSPLSKATIATVGSGVMAEAMIAGLLRGQLVRPAQVVASHPRQERREALEREYGIRSVVGNLQAVRDADVILLGIKPQMLEKVGREIGPELHRGQLVISVLAGATTRALTEILGHDQVVRSMPNTPARLGKGMTVWYATPETTETQREQAAALLGALGHQIQVDDEKMVAMATAVSGTGPTYVFLVMEALIDAAVHLGFPRHIAHDLVIETLEGSTVFAKQSGMHPAELRNMVTSPGGTSAAALHELESGRLRTVLSEAVWAAYRRTVELGDQLEASVGTSAAPSHGRRGADPRDDGGADPA